MIDWSKFNIYLGDYDQAVVLEIVRMFIRDYPEKISALEKHVAARDFQEIFFGAHPLKSNCATLGGTVASEYARELEMMGRNQSEDGIDNTMKALKTSLNTMVAELEVYIKEHSG